MKYEVEIIWLSGIFIYPVNNEKMMQYANILPLVPALLQVANCTICAKSSPDNTIKHSKEHSIYNPI